MKSIPQRQVHPVPPDELSVELALFFLKFSALCAKKLNAFG
jgi:hypothetical protein